ncbi:MAG: hypothetical protein KNN13_06680 [Hydrogenobacter thermophilus]|uniref:hypothetical protein n=1 Tax=Hydrogenobacter thermophilus TaxID=940 RepID=UPI001C78EF82|nr:hypothetical protein [Hydrogenobacter thermophilus]QWK19186.1 MAG: hypothetical protein KNN13_06680 [Hydrogenobacter thermophilus]
MWRRGRLLGLLMMALLLTVESEENVPKSMEPDLKFSYNLDKMTSFNFGVRTPTDFEYLTNKRKYINQYVIWFNVEF